MPGRLAFRPQDLHFWFSYRSEEFLYLPYGPARALNYLASLTAFAASVETIWIPAAAQGIVGFAILPLSLLENLLRHRHKERYLLIAVWMVLAIAFSLQHFLTGQSNYQSVCIGICLVTKLLAEITLLKARRWTPFVAEDAHYMAASLLLEKKCKVLMVIRRRLETLLSSSETPNPSICNGEAN